MLWFGNSLEIPLINLDHILQFGNYIYDYSFKVVFGVEEIDFFISFDTT